MDPNIGVTDPTDWLNTRLSQLAPVEAALRCQVCKDFFTTPMITSCSHTFCSLCIRRCLANDGKCPACRSEEQELRLRRNVTVEELVEAFQRARPDALNLARVTASHEADKSTVGLKRKLDETELGEEVEAVYERRTRSRSERSSRQREAYVEVISDGDDGEFQPEDGLVACPICSRRMKAERVFSHLDNCQADDRNSDPPRSQLNLRPLPLQSGSPAPALKGLKTLERLPKLNYSLYKDNTLKKKLIDLGIPSWGPKALMQRRHTEWVNLWNANCDSSKPRSKRELLQELDVWERTQGGRTPNTSSAPDSAGAVMRKDFDAPAWSASHNSDFQQLIQNARKSNKNRSKLQEEPPISEGQSKDIASPTHQQEVLEDLPAEPQLNGIVQPATSHKLIDDISPDTPNRNVVPLISESENLLDFPDSLEQNTVEYGSISPKNFPGVITQPQENPGAGSLPHTSLIEEPPIQ